MKRILTSALAIVLLAGAAQAQTAPAEGKAHRKGDRKEHRQEMAGLNLTADQKTKLKAIRERQKTEMDALRNQSLTEEQRRTQGRAIHEKYRAEMKAVLTPEQQQKMDQLRQEHPEGRGPGAEGAPGARGNRGERGAGKGDRMAGMQQDLNLTADQQQRIKAIQDQYRPQLEAVRNNNSLTKEQKKEKAKSLHQAQMEQMKAVLTAEQQEKIKAKRKGRKDGGAVR